MAKRRKADGVPPLPTRFQPYRNCANRPPRFSFFLNLPAELRIQVYRHILRIPGAIDADYFWNKPSIDLSLLRVCKQVHQEASHYFYSTNTFCFLEACDDHQEDHDAVFQHRIHYWLNIIGKTNRLSVHRLQLRMRDERGAKYYENLLEYMSSQLPNIKRLGLAMEKHQIGHVRTLSDGHVIDWEPNYIVSISEKKMPRVANGLKSLNLNLLMVTATRDQIQVLNKFSALLQCQVKAIEPKNARRTEVDCRNFFEQKVWYESPGHPYNRQIRQDLRTSGVGEYFEEDIPDEKDESLRDSAGSTASE